VSLSFIPLGVGDAFSRRFYSSCLALEADGQLLLVDCPHPIRKMLKEAADGSGVGLDVDRVSGVALTHLHADHSSGLEGAGYFCHALGRRMPVLAHPDVPASLWQHHLRAGMAELGNHFGDFFELVPLSSERPVAFGAFQLECRRTIHPVPATAFRIRAGGRSLGISADTSFDPELIFWLAAADLVVHETNVGVHTPYEALAALPAELRARMRLIHYPDDFDSGASAIEPLVQGRRYEV